MSNKNNKVTQSNNKEQVVAIFSYYIKLLVLLIPTFTYCRIWLILRNNEINN